MANERTERGTPAAQPKWDLQRIREILFSAMEMKESSLEKCDRSALELAMIASNAIFWRNKEIARQRDLLGKFADTAKRCLSSLELEYGECERPCAPGECCKCDTKSALRGVSATGETAQAPTTIERGALEKAARAVIDAFYEEYEHFESKPSNPTTRALDKLHEELLKTENGR